MKEQQKAACCTALSRIQTGGQNGGNDLSNKSRSSLPRKNHTHFLRLRFISFREEKRTGIRIKRGTEKGTIASSKHGDSATDIKQKRRPTVGQLR